MLTTFELQHVKNIYEEIEVISVIHASIRGVG